MFVCMYVCVCVFKVSYNPDSGLPLMEYVKTAHCCSSITSLHSFCLQKKKILCLHIVKVFP